MNRMGIFDEREAMWKKAEERAKALEEKEKKVKEAAKSVNDAKTEEDAVEAAKKLKSAYDDYGKTDTETKKEGFLDFFKKLLGI